APPPALPGSVLPPLSSEPPPSPTPAPAPASARPSPPGAALPALGSRPGALPVALELSGGAEPVRVGAPGPRAESFAEESRTVKGGETWAQLSQEKYKSPIYAEALRRYNQQHFQASPRMQGDGNLVAGETVYLPDQAKLERQYNSLIAP